MSRPELEPGDLVHVLADNAYGGTGILLDKNDPYLRCTVLLDGRIQFFSIMEIERVEEGEEC